MSLPYRTSGNARPWQHRPSAHTLGNRRWVHGAIQPMREPSLLERLRELLQRPERKGRG